ncbi:MAG: HypC/HybG/HupF family hydrogenase formation chaperone [Candidatus Moraniibacteriota bacterium]
MCLAIPGKIEVLDGRKARVDFDGVKRQVDVSFLDDAEVGDWVLVHVGFAIQTIDEEAAREAYRLLADSRKEEMERELKQLS